MGNTVKALFVENGIKHIADANSGNPLGMARCSHAWHNNKRQPSGQVYDLSRVTVFTNTTVQQLLFSARNKGEKPAVTGVQTADGVQLHATHEVVLSAGALRTPHILMHSGIGKADVLQGLGIEAVFDAPDVGQNLHDRKSFPCPFPLILPPKELPAIFSHTYLCTSLQ